MINLHDYVSVGQNSMYSKVVQHSDTSESYSSGLKNLLATPKLIHMAIEAGIQTVEPYLPHEYVSVGISTSFVHTAPTSLGMTVTVRTSIIAIEEHNILLEIQAWDEQGDIGHGKHKRAIVTKEEVERKASERTQFLTNREH
jgi:fluoroacetyl-CoA thioesterase